jgi:hypothetical protein
MIETTADQIQRNIISIPSSSSSSSSDEDGIATIYNASATNIKILAHDLFDPIIAKLSQSQQNENNINITTMSCTMIQIFSYVQETTIPNIVSLMEVLITQSNNQLFQDIYQSYQLSSQDSTTTSTTKSSLQCTVSNQLLSSDMLSTARQNNVFPIVSWLSACNDNMSIVEHLAAILINIVLFPLSIVVGTLVGILSLFLLVIPGRAPATLLILTFGAPFFILFFIFRNIRAILQDLINPMVQLLLSNDNETLTTAHNNDSDTRIIEGIIERLYVVLDTPMSYNMMIATIPQQRTDQINNNETTKILEMSCEMKALSCKNDALMDALPY